MDCIQNVIFIIVHDIGMELGCYGKPILSPNLDGFAAGGVRFANAFTNSPCCSPSRCCIMTGKYAHVSGGIGLAHMGWPLPAEQRTVVDEFNRHGIETAHFGHNHERHAGENRYRIDEERDWGDGVAEMAVDKAIPYIESRARSGQRFYLNIGIASTHRSHYSKKYSPDRGGGLPPEQTHVPLFVPETPDTRREYGTFGAALRDMDRHVGRLFDTMERLRLFGNSLVIFTTDHGIVAPRSKGTLYDRGVETAMLMRAPGIVGGTVVDHLIQNIDLAPTVLEAMGVPVPPDMQGRSLWPLLTAGRYEPHEAVFVERNFHGEMLKGDVEHRDLFDPIRAVRTDRFHYIRWVKPDLRERSLLPWELLRRQNSPAGGLDEPWADFDGARPSEELYDIRQDPLEFVNLAGKPEYACIKASLAEKLDQWMRNTNDFAITGQTPVRYEAASWGSNWPRTDNNSRFIPDNGSGNDVTA